MESSCTVIGFKAAQRAFMITLSISLMSISFHAIMDLVLFVNYLKYSSTSGCGILSNILTTFRRRPQFVEPGIALRMRRESRAPNEAFEGPRAAANEVSDPALHASGAAL
jgi:hypothetical protein